MPRALVKRIGQAHRLREQLDKRGDGPITAQFAEAGLSEADLKDRDKLERLEAKPTVEEPPPVAGTRAAALGPRA